MALGMTVSELGDRMSNWELNVFWPAYFQSVQKQKDAEEAKG